MPENNRGKGISDKSLLRTGVVGTVVAALCCFTPVLVILLGAAGLSAFTGYLDYVLLPALVASVCLIVYALHRRRRAGTRGDEGPQQISR